MPTERENMLAGADYDPRDPELTAGRRRARALLFDFNHSGPDEDERRARLLAELLGGAGPRLWIEPPFRCDYGAHIHLGAQVYFNFGCVILDPAEVRVGDRVLFGPGVQIYTATHPWTWRDAAPAWNPPAASRSAATSGWAAERSCCRA